MTRLSAALLVALAMMPTAPAAAAELLFVEVKSCVYCIRFNKQMAGPYQASELGQKVPLRRVNLMERWPADLKAVDRPPYTPVFILVENGKEVGRFNGYVNARQFNRDLKRLLGASG
jgi:thioredoxin-related protein